MLGLIRAAPTVIGDMADALPNAALPAAIGPPEVKANHLPV